MTQESVVYSVKQESAVHRVKQRHEPGRIHRCCASLSALVLVLSSLPEPGTPIRKKLHQRTRLISLRSRILRQSYEAH